MICVIFSTRLDEELYPLTRLKPKALFDVNKKKVLDHLLDEVDATEYIICAMSKFIPAYEEYIDKHPKMPFTLIDIGNEEMNYVDALHCVVKQKKIEEDTLFFSCDGLVDFSLNDFVVYVREKKNSAVLTYFELDQDIRKQYYTVELCGGNILSVEQNKLVNKSQWCCPNFLFLKEKNIRELDRIYEYNPSAKNFGEFIQYFIDRERIYAYEIQGNYWNLMAIEELGTIEREFHGINKGW